MRKQDTLAKWKQLTPTDPLPLMQVIPYKATGSRYGACGIRIDGNPAFIDAVLSQLKTLIAGENCVTRLELARNDVDGSKLGKAFHNADTGAQVCYIRLHQRGNEGQHVAAYDRELREATDLFAAAHGVK